MTGPACIGGVEGNCCDIKKYSYGKSYADCAALGVFGTAPGGGAATPGGGGAATPPPTSSNPCVTYSVARGDTLGSIAADFTGKTPSCAVTAQAIADFNMVADMNTIDVGETYNIPCPGNCCTDNSCTASLVGGSGGAANGKVPDGNGGFRPMTDLEKARADADAKSSTNGKLSTAVGLLATTVVALLAFIYRSKRVEGGALMRAEAAVLSWMPSSGAATTPPLPTTKRMSQNPGNDSALNLKSAAGTI